MVKQNGSGLVDIISSVSIPMGLIVAREYFPELSRKIKKTFKHRGGRKKRKTFQKNKKYRKANKTKNKRKKQIKTKRRKHN